MLRITPDAHREVSERLDGVQHLTILGIREGGCSFTMRFALVQGDIPGSSFHCIQKEDITYCLDKDILDMYPEIFTLDYVKNQGFRLYTNSQYMASHMNIFDSIEQI
jgi:hypothetical protein